MDTKEERMERYIEDITHIRALLEQNEERPVIRPWAFYVWGLIVLVGTGVSIYLGRKMGIDGHGIFFTVGLPGLLIGALAEIKALTSQMRKQALPIFSYRLNRCYLAFMGILIPMLFCLYFLIDVEAPLAGLLVMISTIPVFMYGLISFSSLFFNGYVMLVIGFIMLFVNPPSPRLLEPIAGALIGISYIIGGLQTRGEVKRLNG